MNKTFKLKEPKTCSCGRIHLCTNADSKLSFDEFFAGVYWNCQCGSTNSVKHFEVEPTKEQLELYETKF